MTTFAAKFFCPVPLLKMGVRLWRLVADFLGVFFSQCCVYQTLLSGGLWTDRKGCPFFNIVCWSRWRQTGSLSSGLGADRRVSQQSQISVARPFCLLPPPFQRNKRRWRINGGGKQNVKNRMERRRMART